MSLQKRWSRLDLCLINTEGWTLLLSWAPVIGDPLTFIAGVLRYDFKIFGIIVFVAKGLRYAVIIFLANSLSV